MLIENKIDYGMLDLLCANIMVHLCNVMVHKYEDLGQYNCVVELSFFDKFLPPL